VFYLPQSLVTSGWQLLVMQAMVGVCMGGLIPAISALLARYTQEGEEGAVYGLDHSITSAARAVAPLAGAAVAAWFGLRATFVATGLLYLMAAVVANCGLTAVRTSR
jgi:DHA1 family multidrug resistance protein-like MFS transporter